MKKIFSYFNVLLLFIFVFVSVLAGPLSDIAHAVTTTGGGGGGSTGPLVQISLSWVNECDISGTVIDTEGGNSQPTNVSLVDPSCMQDYLQLGSSNSSTYQFEDNTTCQTSDVQAAAGDPSQPITQGTIYYEAPGASGGACESYNFNTTSNSVSVGSPGNANIVYVLNGTTIERVDGNTGYNFTQSTTNPNIYTNSNDTNGCNDTIVVSGSSATLWELSQPAGNANAWDPSNIKAPSSFASGCYVSYYDDDINGPATYGTDQRSEAPGSGFGALGGSICATNGDTTSGTYCSNHPQQSDGSFAINLGTSANATPGVTGGGSGASGNQPSCQESGGPLSWLTCAIIDGIGTLEQHVENLLKNVLTTPPIDLNSANCNSGSQDYSSCIYNVWSEFRVYANIFLVIILLVVVIAEAGGGGTISAYTIRKVLPRILITAILINISIYIMAAMVDVTNILGQGIFNLLTLPFKAAGTYHINITAGVGNFIGGTAAVGGGLLTLLVGSSIAHHTFWSSVSGGGFGDAVSFLALFVVLPAVLAILGVLLTIFFRTVLIVLLLMTAPIAFALYCLPNTEKFFHKWWETLFKTLMVFPVVMVIFALCDVGSVVVSSFTTGSEQWVGELLAILGVTAPLFLVPFAFKLSGGVIGSLHGAITNMGHKAQEGIKGNPNDMNSLRNRTKRKFAIRRAAAGLNAGAIGTRLNPRQLTSTGRRNAASRLSVQKQAGLELLRRQSEETPYWKVMSNDSRIMKQLAEYSGAKNARQANEAQRKAGTITDQEYDLNNTAIAAAEKTGWNPAVRRSALLNSNYIKFETKAGEAGWNKSMMLAEEIAGSRTTRDANGEIVAAAPNYDGFQFSSIQNEYQSIAKGPAGRPDQAGNTDGNPNWDGYKAANANSLWEIGNGHPKAVAGFTDYFSGLTQRIDTNTFDVEKDASILKEAKERGMDPREVAAEAVGAYNKELGSLGSNAKGGVRDAALAAERKMGDVIGGSSYLENYVKRNVASQTGGAVAGTLDPRTKAGLLGQVEAVSHRARGYEPPSVTAANRGPGP